MQFRLDHGERELVKQAGGYWGTGRKAWSLRFGKVPGPGLEGRLMDKGFASWFLDMHAGMLYTETINPGLPIAGRFTHTVQ